MKRLALSICLCEFNTRGRRPCYRGSKHDSVRCRRAQL